MAGHFNWKKHRLKRIAKEQEIARKKEQKIQDKLRLQYQEKLSGLKAKILELV